MNTPPINPRAELRACQPPTRLNSWTPLETGKPNTGNPESGKPETGEPESGEPDSGKPESGKPETGKPEYSKLESGKPEPGNATSLRGDLASRNDRVSTRLDRVPDLTTVK